MRDTKTMAHGIKMLHEVCKVHIPEAVRISARQEMMYRLAQVVFLKWET